jgi:hypothetical protein
MVVINIPWRWQKNKQKRATKISKTRVMSTQTTRGIQP